METIKLLTPGRPVPIQIGTEVRLKVQPRLTDGSIFNVEALQDIVIKVAGAKTVYEHTIEDGFISLILPATEIEGVYDVFMEATIDDRPVCCAWNDLYSRVRYSNCINYDEYRCDFLVIGSTDEELEAMKRAAEEKKQDYIEAHAEAVAARDAYIRKTESLDGVAKETTSQTILSKLDAIHIDLTPVLQAIESAKAYLKGKLDEATTTIGQWFTSGKQEILTKIEAIPAPDLSTVAKEVTLTTESAAIKTAIAKGGGNPSKMAYEAMKRVQEYLYAIEYSELDYEAARNFFKTHFAPINGACTALRKGDIIGRNYDWTYSKEVSFLVRTKAHNGRYASIGMAGSIAALTTDTIGEYSEEFKYMPFRLLDGLNEKGVYANVNMLNNAEGRTLPTTGTVPLIEERERICSAMLVRYILDNFATPQEACEYIRNYVAVYPPYHDGATTDLHFAVSSKEQLYYLCFEQENGVWRTMYVDVKNQPLPFVMTNFRMWWAQYIFDTETGHYNRFADPDYDYVEKYGMGIERANLCLDFVRHPDGQSVLDFMTNDLAYTRSYMELTDPQWLTEFVGQYSEEDLARNSAAEDFERILGIVRQRYAERSRETALTWQTVHSVTYDLEHLTMQLVVQEGSAEDAITIDCFKSLPASKGDLENIDFSDVAKQGSNSNVSLTTMDAKLGNVSPATDEEIVDYITHLDSILV